VAPDSERWIEVRQREVFAIARCMPIHTERSHDRSFGLSVGSVVCAIAAVVAWRGRLVRAEVLAAIGVLLIVFGIAAPALLKWPSWLWWRFARALGYVNARVLLTVLFAVAVVPLGIVWKLIGKDPLARRRDTRRGWARHPPRYHDSKHYERMF